MAQFINNGGDLSKIDISDALASGLIKIKVLKNAVLKKDGRIME